MVRTTQTLLIAAATAVSADASAFGRLVTDDGRRAALASASVVVARSAAGDTWLLAGTVETSAPAVRWILALPAGGTLAVDAKPALTALDHFTAPRLERFEPRDPCGPQGPSGKPVVDRAWRATPAGDHTSWPMRTAAAGVRLIPVDADLESTGAARAPLERLTRRGHTLRAVRAILGKGRRHTLAPLSIRVPPGTPLPLDLAAADAPAGRLLELELWILDGAAQVALAGPFESATLPTDVALPEVAHDAPHDLRADLRRASIRAASGPIAILEYAAPADSCDPCTRPPLSKDALASLGWTGASPFISRLHVSIGATHLRHPTALSATKNRRIVQARWFFRRPWREPVTCDRAARHARGLRVQQLAEARTWATLTGLGAAQILEAGERAGYLFKAAARAAPR